MKFIHMADVHLGVQPDKGKPWSEARQQEIKDTFVNNNLGTKIEKASSGKDLVARLKTKEYNSITTTLIHKFNIT